MQSSIAEKSSHKSQSENTLTKQEEQEISENLPMHVSMQLYKLMNRVVKDDVNADNVNAACNCAAQICKMLDITFKAEKMGR
jgi:hypothetical protein